MDNNINQKEHEKFIKFGGKWAVESVVLDLFNVNDLEEAVNGNTYVGKQASTGDYLIDRISYTSTFSGATGTVIRRATTANNTQVDYASAWNNRLTLTYGTFAEAFPS